MTGVYNREWLLRAEADIRNSKRSKVVVISRDNDFYQASYKVPCKKCGHEVCWNNPFKEQLFLRNTTCPLCNGKGLFSGININMN